MKDKATISVNGVPVQGVSSFSFSTFGADFHKSWKELGYEIKPVLKEEKGDKEIATKERT